MKTKNVLCVFTALVVAAVMGGCAGGGPVTKTHDFVPQDLNPLIQSGEYVQKVDTFLVLLDTSGTMYETIGGHRKLDVAKDIVSRMNRTIPDLKLTSGLRTLGQNFSSGSRLVYGMTDYSKEGLEGALGPISGGGMTPLAGALNGCGGDLQSASGNMALIVVSDGQETDTSSVASAQGLKSAFGDRLCIYTVMVGDNPGGTQLMNQVAQESGCGFSVNADEITSSENMANFVKRVFLAKGDGKPLDSDGDGVPDNLDKCPNTPRGVKVDEVGCPIDTDGDGVPDYLDKCPETPAGVEVDAAGCPVDTDGDGVPDYLDKCPGTPTGATVNEQGCWVLEGLYFDTDKSDIKRAGYPILQDVIAVLKQNPGLKVEIQGHTDSRGSDAYNQTLSEKRAQAVLDYMVNAGIDAGRLKATGYGESRPAAPNDSDENMAKNRRVQLDPIF
ncbi:MAG: OmpA family protein [Desulfatiglandales bacterium]